MIPLVLLVTSCMELDDAEESETAADATAVGVKLSLARVDYTWTSAGRVAGHLTGRAQVQNLPSDGPARLFVKYRVTNPRGVVRDWTTADGHLVRGDDWEFTTPDYAIAANLGGHAIDGASGANDANIAFQFVVGYTVDGVTRWDNNGGKGKDYRLASAFDLPGAQGPSATLGAAHVVQLESRLEVGAVWHGSVLVDNLAYAKTVDLLYAIDGGTTERTLAAQFEQAAPGTAGKLESWRFAKALGGGSDVHFKIRYRVAGKTYVDDNLGRRYTVHVQP